jgi:hypothetical protein
MKKTLAAGLIIVVFGFSGVCQAQPVIERLTPELLWIVAQMPDQPDPKSAGYGRDLAQGLRQIEEIYTIQNVTAINYAYIGGFYHAGSYTKELLVVVKRRSR